MKKTDTTARQSADAAIADARGGEDIHAFVIDGRHVCFQCYDPNTDKEEDVLSSGFFAQTNHILCNRCNRVIRPERRAINRRDGTDRRFRQEPIAGPDRRSGEERRRQESRRKKRCSVY